MGPLDRTVWCFEGIVRRGPSADEKRLSFRGRVASPPVVLTGWGPVRAWVPAITLATGDRAGGPHRQGCITSGPVGRGTVRPVGPQGPWARWADGTAVLRGPWDLGAVVPVGPWAGGAVGPVGRGGCRARRPGGPVGPWCYGALGPSVPWGDWASRPGGQWCRGTVGPSGPWANCPAGPWGRWCRGAIGPGGP